MQADENYINFEKSSIWTLEMPELKLSEILLGFLAYTHLMLLFFHPTPTSFSAENGLYFFSDLLLNSLFPFIDPWVVCGILFCSKNRMQGFLWVFCCSSVFFTVWAFHKQKWLHFHSISDLRLCHSVPQMWNGSLKASRPCVPAVLGAVLEIAGIWVFRQLYPDLPV